MTKYQNSSSSRESQLATAIDELMEHFVLFDAQDRIILANKAWKEFNKDIIETTEPGVKFEDHLRAAVAKGLILEAVGREEDWIRERMERHRNPRGPFEVARQDGSWILAHEQRLPNNSTILIISNITEQKNVENELRDSKERFQAFLKNLPAKMHIKDTQGRYLMINPVTENLFGISNEEAVGKTVKDILPQVEGEVFDSHDKTVITTGLPKAIEEEFETCDGQRTFLTVKFPIHDANGNVAAIGASGIDISERKKIEQLLRNREQELNSLVESAPYDITRYDLDCRAVYVSRIMPGAVGISTTSLIGKTPIEGKFDGLVGIENYEKKLRRVISSGEPDEVNLMVPCREGGIKSDNVCFIAERTYHVCFVAERNSEGDVIGALAFGRDVTESKHVDEELRIAAIALDSHEAIVITDANKIIIKVNQSFTKITGYGAEEAIGHTMEELLESDHHDDLFFDAMRTKLEWDQCWEGEIWYRHKDGGVFPHRLNFAAVTDDDEHVSHYVGAFSDITQQKQNEEMIHSLAFFDSLTDLPNRRMLQDRLGNALISSARNKRRGAILFMDLDNFKDLNDTKGHGVGDMLLVEVAKRLQASVRENDTVARLGGDEFVLVLSDLNEGERQAAVQAEVIAESIRDSINQSVDLQGYKYQCSPSIGISMFHGTDVSDEELLKRADSAMYQAKKSGRNAIRFFDPEIHAAMEARFAMEADLRRAIADDQLKLFYQMQVNSMGHIIGAEALLRWQHPQDGLIPAADFITLAEESGLILPIGHWVLETACAQLKKWEALASARHLQLAVNISARQFHQVDFVKQVSTVLEKTAIDPSKLKFEFTESLMLDNVSATVIKMRILKKMGIHFSIDDFGTGHSSLAYLTQLPLDQLKVDKSFVRNIGLKPSDSVIVQTIIGMAKNLGMDVIAEGVETIEQRDFLFDSGCLSFQGSLYGWPVSLEEFEAWLIEYSKDKSYLSCAN